MGNLKESPLTTRRLLRFRHVRLVLVTELLAIERFSLFSSTANVYQLYIYKYASPGSFFFNSHSQLSLSLLFLSDAMLDRSPQKKKWGALLQYTHWGRKKKVTIPEVVVYVPAIRIPLQSDLPRALKGVIPKELVDRLTCLRNQIVLVAEDTDGSAITELRRALEEYLTLLIGLTKKENGLEDLVEFKWKNLGDYVKQETFVANSWFELLSIVHMMAMLTLSEANSLMIPKDVSGSGVRVLSSDYKREAVDLLLKASGYLEFCTKNIIVHIPLDIKIRLPKDLQDGVLEAISIQALGQGTEIQLGLAVDCQKATLSVKRRLACELLIYYSQAYQCLSGCDMNHGYGKKHLWFIKWKFLEAKAAAYYYHGLILDKGNEPSCHVSAVCCFLAAEEILAESKKACLTFSLAPPTTRSPPLWGAMKHLHQKIPEVASRKSQMYGYLLEEEKALQALPELPNFQLSLRPDNYELPEIDQAWNTEKWEIESQTLKEHLKDCENNTGSDTESE